MQKIQYDFTTKHRNGQALQLTGFLHEPGAHLPQQQWPILFFIPGGGLTHIEADVDDNIALAFYNHGFSTFYMDYRFRSDQQPLLPAPLLDVANGLQVIHDHAATWHLDNDKTVLAGFSIGGLLASLLADLPENQQFLSEHGLTGSTLKSQALILGYPVTDLTMGWPHTPAELPEIAADPALYVAKNWLTPQHVLEYGHRWRCSAVECLGLRHDFGQNGSAGGISPIPSRSPRHGLGHQSHRP